MRTASDDTACLLHKEAAAGSRMRRRVVYLWQEQQSWWSSSRANSPRVACLVWRSEIGGLQTGYGPTIATARVSVQQHQLTALDALRTIDRVALVSARRLELLFPILLGRWTSIAHLCEAMRMVLVHLHGALPPWLGLSRLLLPLLFRFLLSAFLCLLASAYIPVVSAQSSISDGLSVLDSPAPNTYEPLPCTRSR